MINPSVVDALSPFGVTVTRLPVSPARIVAPLQSCSDET